LRGDCFEREVTIIVSGGLEAQLSGGEAGEHI
jgi:hypothetical protein